MLESVLFPLKFILSKSFRGRLFLFFFFHGTHSVCQKFAFRYIWRFLPRSLLKQHRHISSPQPKHFAWAHGGSSILSCRALKLYLARFLGRGDWPTIGGWRLSVNGQAVMSRSPRGNIWAPALLWRPQVGLIPDRKCNGSRELRQNMSAEFKISSFLAARLSDHHMMEKVEWNTQGSVLSLGAPPALCYFCQWVLISFGLYLISGCKQCTALPRCKPATFVSADGDR